MKLELVAPESPPRDPIAAWRRELDAYYEQMRGFVDLEPDEIFICLAGISARLSEMRSLLVRMQTRAATALKTQEVDFALAEVDRQFRTWSRVLSSREFDWKLSGPTP